MQFSFREALYAPLRLKGLKLFWKCNIYDLGNEVLMKRIIVLNCKTYIFSIKLTLIVDFLIAQAPWPFESNEQFFISPPPLHRDPKPLHLFPSKLELRRLTLDRSWSTKTPHPRGFVDCLQLSTYTQKVICTNDDVKCSVMTRVRGHLNWKNP